MDEARHETTTIAGDRDLRYAEYGDPNGSPVVFLHGTPGSSRLAALFDSAAAQSGVRLLAPDRPGFGESSPWPERAVNDAPRFLTPVLDDAGVDTAGLVAFSGGSPYALATAATVPDRITRVDVVAGATPPTTDDETPAVQRLLTGLATTTPRILRGLFRGQAWLADRLDPSFVTAQYTTGGTTDPSPTRRGRS
ncbi:alpha/beta fold hydrolase [Halolamina pelagica]|uniref:alpha/beta fold hydrolase n=1 Tax=Halolamina pelagica TaxID=699431 RepID=UPI001EFB4394|nr:alpha/beta hydrolase [Halolamina pelagica]